MSGRLRPDDRGAYTFSVVLTALSVLLAGVLINRVAWTAEAINDKARNISATAGNIGSDAEAVAELAQTNELAGSILATAEPLDAKLKEIVALARSVDETAKSINASAGTVDDTATKINETAGAVDGTAKGINTTAAAVLATAKSINRGLVQINTNLEATIGIVTAIKGDTGNILGQARTAHKTAACIDESSGGTPDGHCR